MHTLELARAYHRGVHAATGAAVSGEEEAQLTTPVSNLFTALADMGGFGELQLIRETRLDRTRPDFAALLVRGTRRMQKGYVELKSPQVPNLHYFRGNFGGKDIIPLWRDAAATLPNMTRGLAALLGKRLGIEPPPVEDLAAYAYALLSASAYQDRFAEALQTAGLRVPLTADRALWLEAVEAGQELLWLHTYAQRFSDRGEKRGGHVPFVEGIGWDEPVRKIPGDMSGIRYDEQSGTLCVGDGRVGGVRPDVWGYEVSGMPLLKKWLGYRTAKGTGRATTSESALDYIRPTAWADEWNDELLDLIRVLTLTLDRQEALADLLDRVCEGPLIPADQLPEPGELERQPPATSR